MANYAETAKAVTDDDILAAKFMIKLLDTLLRILSCQYLVLFLQSETYLWPFHMIISVLSTVPFFLFFFFHRE